VSAVTMSSSMAVVLNLGVATQNRVAGNIPRGREYCIKITFFFFILDELNCLSTPRGRIFIIRMRGETSLSSRGVRCG
jgi:hypothetical protein